MRVRIVPKTNFSPRGITIRSLSRYLGLCYESVRVRWRSSEGRGLGSVGRSLSTCVESSTLWTADGRRHANVPRLKLGGVRQLRAEPTGGRRFTFW